MILTYHQKSIEILGITPQISQLNLELVSAFEAKYELAIPLALREWYSLENNSEILQEITGSHNIIEITITPKVQEDYSQLFSASEPFPVLIENQAVWFMAVKLNEGENPPVYMRYNEADELWTLHANSFSDWIQALCWDYIVITKSQGKIVSAKHENQLLGFHADAPETYEAHIYFKGKKFTRMKKGAEYLFVIY